MVLDNINPLVRTAVITDLFMLERDVKGMWGKNFEEDLAEQKSGIHSCFLAFSNSKIIGSGFIRWAGPRDARANVLFPEAPEIYRFEVQEKLRSKGIGQKIIVAMEKEAKKRGYHAISLGVGHENTRAYSLYKKIGFTDTSLTDYYDEYFYPTADGGTKKARDLCRYLIKSI